MLLFSTILEIDQRLTKDDFINLVIEWNQKGHPESVISGIEWNGERNIRFEDENKCLEIQEYRNKNIIADQMCDSTAGFTDCNSHGNPSLYETMRLRQRSGHFVKNVQSGLTKCCIYNEI